MEHFSATQWRNSYGIFFAKVVLFLVKGVFWIGLRTRLM